MAPSRPALTAEAVPLFSRARYADEEPITAIGAGCLGGKASGLVAARRLLTEAFPDGTHRGIAVAVPRLVVLATDVFDLLLERSGGILAETGGEADERIAHAFLRADFPTEFLGDLRALVQATRAPLAVRSSSMLEDALNEPFAGIYGTKMIPNHQPDASLRFRQLLEAVKFVYASTFFREARGYRSRLGRGESDEKMAVIVQEVVGRRHGERYYPTVSGVARSWNFYPSGPAKPEEGVIDLALGLGKTIVDGEASWALSPAHPNADPPVTLSEMLKASQTRFWAVNLGRPPAHDPVRETEYLVRAELEDAELDGALCFVASTYDPGSDRIAVGIGRKGPRLVNFAPLVRMGDVPLPGLVRILLDRCEEGLGAEVEIEFALTLDPLRREPPRFGFLQVRPILVSTEEVELAGEELVSEATIVASTRVLGHGSLETIRDVVYVRPDVFKKEMNARIAREIDGLNRGLREEGRECVLVTFGRLGSSDPWLGVPVDWGQISQARVIVEATTPEFDVELSQGAHFFHNMTNLRIFYFTVPHHGPHAVKWDWLDRQEIVGETEHVRHVRAATPLRIRVDGRRGRGVIQA